MNAHMTVSSAVTVEAYDFSEPTVLLVKIDNKQYADYVSDGMAAYVTCADEAIKELHNILQDKKKRYEEY